MGEWESAGVSDEWYTPKYIFDAMECTFDMDVAAALVPTHVPSLIDLTLEGLESSWAGFVWMNPPFGARMAIAPWLEKFFDHGNGVALTPDRTSAPWYRPALEAADVILVIRSKVKFERPDGSVGGSPGTGTTLFGVGSQAVEALLRAQVNGLGTLLQKVPQRPMT